MIRSELLASHGVTGVFTTRLGGISPTPFDSLNFGHGLGDNDENIRQNLKLLLARSGIDATPHQVHQVHKTDLLWCQGEGCQHDVAADILLTGQRNVSLAVRTADCLPLVLADSVAGITASVHSGWRGTVALAASVAIDAMRSRGSLTQNILASLGPCIGPCCFAIDVNTAEQLAHCCPDAALHVQSNGSPISADIAAINRLQLLQAGLLPENIESLNQCTACHPELFFSHRRDKGNTGRHLAVVAHPATL